MAYEDLLTDRCDVYYLKTRGGGTLYGVPQPLEYYYDTAPDAVSVACYAKRADGNSFLTVDAPERRLIERMLIHFTIDTVLHMNDKIKLNGTFYKLLNPRPIKDHHIEVEAVRSDPYEV